MNHERGQGAHHWKNHSSRNVSVFDWAIFYDTLTNFSQIKNLKANNTTQNVQIFGFASKTPVYKDLNLIMIK